MGVETTLNGQPQGSREMDRPIGTTFILPDVPWASLLEVIARDARPGDTIEVHTEAMRELAEAALQAEGRVDVVVALRAPRPRPNDRAA
jgi:hypothetical protein